MHFFSPGVFCFALEFLPGYNPGSGIELHSSESALVRIRCTVQTLLGLECLQLVLRVTSYSVNVLTNYSSQSIS